MVRLRDSWPFSLSPAPTVGNPRRPLQPESLSDRHPLGPPGRVGAPAAPGPRAWGSTRDDVSRWYQHPGSPQGGGRGKKGGTSKGRDEREALGRSRGGYGTKACVIADGLGRAVAFILAPGQAHELPHAIPLLERLPGVPQWVVADRGLSRHAFREHIWNLGARPAIPSKQNEAPVCVVPESRGALSRDEEDALWQEFYTAVLHGSFTRQFYTAVLHGSFTRQFYTAVLHGSFTRQFYTAVLHGSFTRQFYTAVLHGSF